MPTSNSEVVFITGASSGIGKACAHEFYRQGYSVILFARRKERLESLAQELKRIRPEGETLVIPGDVTDRLRVFEAMREAAEKMGGIDVLINNAGMGLNSFIETMDPQHFQDVLDLNVMGVLHCTQAVIPVMKKQKSGQIVNVTSVIGKRGVPSRSAYCTSKFAVEGLSESIRTELKPYGIEIIVARPARTDTEFFDAESRGKDYLESTGGGRMPSEKVARAIYNGVRRHKRTVTIGFSGKMLVFISTLFPKLADRIAAKIFGNLRKKGSDPLQGI